MITLISARALQNRCARLAGWYLPGFAIACLLTTVLLLPPRLEDAAPSPKTQLPGPLDVSRLSWPEGYRHFASVTTPIRSISWSSQFGIIAVGTSQRVSLWDVNTGSELFHAPCLVKGLDFLTSGDMLAIASYNNIEDSALTRANILDVNNLDTWVPPDRRGTIAYDVRAGQDGLFLSPLVDVTGSPPSGIGLFYIDVQREKTFEIVPRSVFVYAFAAATRAPLVFVARSSKARNVVQLEFWAFRPPTLIYKIDRAGDIRRVAVSADGRIAAFVVSDSGQAVETFDVIARKPLGRASVQWGQGISLAPDGSIVAVGESTRISIYSSKDLRRLRTINSHRGAVSVLAFSPQGGLLASGDQEGNLMVWKVD